MAINLGVHQAAPYFQQSDPEPNPVLCQNFCIGATSAILAMEVGHLPSGRM